VSKTDPDGRTATQNANGSWTGTANELQELYNELNGFADPFADSSHSGTKGKPTNVESKAPSASSGGRNSEKTFTTTVVIDPSSGKRDENGDVIVTDKVIKTQLDQYSKFLKARLDLNVVYKYIMSDLGSASYTMKNDEVRPNFGISDTLIRNLAESSDAVIVLLRGHQVFMDAGASKLPATTIGVTISHDNGSFRKNVMISFANAPNKMNVFVHESMHMKHPGFAPPQYVRDRLFAHDHPFWYGPSHNQYFDREMLKWGFDPKY
jgi:hypothetical protein